MPSDDKKKEEGKKMEVIDLTLDLDDEKSSTNKDIDFNLFVVPIVCPHVYTRNQTNAARVPVGVLSAAFHGSVYLELQAIQATWGICKQVLPICKTILYVQGNLNRSLPPCLSCVGCLGLRYFFSCSLRSIAKFHPDRNEPEMD
jgi:hypothetical protein